MVGNIGRLSTIPYATVPDDLDVRIIRKGAVQQLERGKVTTPHDDESLIAHGTPLFLVSAPDSLRSIRFDGRKNLVDQFAATKK
jgi:hypothetical protein